MKRFVRSQRRALDRLLRKRVAGTGLEPHEYLARMEVRTGPPVPPLREPEPSFRRYLWLDERARAASEADARDLRALVGTPPEVLAAIERVENETGRAIRDAWPSFRAVVHGGVKFTPFAQALRLRCGPGIRFVEVIRPAEGVTLAAKGRLRPDKRVYFEFVPLAGGDARGADELHSRVPYRVLVTDGEEHWRYDGGCVVRFEGPRRVVGSAPQEFLYSAPTTNSHCGHSPSASQRRSTGSSVSSSISARAKSHADSPWARTLAARGQLVPSSR